LTFTVVRIFTFHWSLSNLYRKIGINVQPLHEDGAGGFSSIGEIVGSYFYLVLAGIAFLLAVGLTEYSRSQTVSTGLMVEYILFPIITIAAFFWPLQSTHKAMLRSSHIALSNINRVFEKKKLSLFEIKDRQLINGFDELNQLTSNSIELRNHYPSWPFNSRILRRFFVALGASFLPIIISILQNILIDYYF
jgi:hypothetical protein